MAKRSEKREEFLNDILTTAIEGGIDYWVQEWVEIDLDNSSESAFDWRYRSATFIDVEGDKYTITPETIAKGINFIVKRNADRDKQLILNSRTNGDDGDHDALDADKIVQFALFNNELVYG